MSMECRFPNLYRYSTLELLPAAGLGAIVWAVVSAIAGALSRHQPFWGAVAQAVALCGLAVFGGVLALCGFWDLRNGWVRRSWVRSFERRVGPEELEPLLGADPGRYVIHVRYYGGFDVNSMAPAVLIEDRSSGQFLVAHPSPPNLSECCESLRVQVKKH